ETAMVVRACNDRLYPWELTIGYDAVLIGKLFHLFTGERGKHACNQPAVAFGPRAVFCLKNIEEEEQLLYCSNGEPLVHVIKSVGDIVHDIMLPEVSGQVINIC